MTLAGSDFTATTDGWDTGLSGIITVAIYQDGDALYGPTTAGIVELDSTGVYEVSLVAPEAPGEYTIVWRAGPADEDVASEILEVTAAGGGTTPTGSTLDQVGALLRARTKTPNAGEIGTFTSETRPTDVQANIMISQAAGYMSLSVGDNIPDRLVDEVNQMVALRAAMLIELSYYPEQVASDRSAYAQYKELWDEAMGTAETPGWLVLAVRRAADDGLVTSDLNLPKYNFPKSRPLVW